MFYVPKRFYVPVLRVKFYIEKSQESEEWYYEDGLSDYLKEAQQGFDMLPVAAFYGFHAGKTRGCGLGSQLVAGRWRNGG